MAAQRQAIEDEIGQKIAELQGHYYGHSPSRWNCMVTDEVVVVVLEETFSVAERTLIRGEETEGIQSIRHRFQQIASADFKAVVEQATGQQVRSFMSDTDLHEDVSVEVFLLAAAMEDMTDFEEAGVKE